MEKLAVWDLFDNDSNDLDQSQHEIQCKKIKTTTTNNLKNEIPWLKSLLLPHSETFFTKFHVNQVISSSKQQIICKVTTDPNQGAIYKQYDEIVGFFNIWWWKEWLERVDFVTLKELTDSFGFIERIRRNDSLIPGSKNKNSEESNNFYLYVNEPKIISNENDKTIGLLTGKKFLIIDY